jgi:hypothetical protein
MKHIRTFLKPVSYALILTMVFTSCGQFEPAQESVPDFSGEEIFAGVFFSSGEFAKKIPSYRDNVNALETMNPEQKAAYDKSLAELLNAIKTKNPEFFTYFKTSVMSKDHQVIEKAIINGGKEIYANIKILYPNFEQLFERIESDYKSGEIVTDGKVDKKKIETKKDEYFGLVKENMISSKSGKQELVPCTFALVCVAYFVLAVHNQVALTFNVAAALTVAVAVAATVTVAVTEEEAARTGVANGDSDLLALEILVDELATISN